jgi:BlaI family transcriptional regulator, penicillinase repressor
MKPTRLTRLELEIMEALWTNGRCSIREIQETFPAKRRPAYTTVQATLYRIEAKKKIVRRVKRIGNADIFEATISRDEAQGTLIDELLALLGGRTKPVMAYFVKTGKLTLQDVKEAEKMLRELAKKEKPS